MISIRAIVFAFCIVLACSCLILFLSNRASAGDIIAWANEADIVCVANLASTQPVHDSSSNSLTPYKTLLNTLRVVKILKGTLPLGDFKIESYPLDIDKMQRLGTTTIPGRRPFGGFRYGENYLLFVKHSTNTSYVDMISSTSAIDIGNNLADMPLIQPLLANVVSQFSVALSGSDQEVQLSVLTMVDSLGKIFWDKIPPTETLARQEIANISEKDKALIIKNLQEQLIPVLLSLTKSNSVPVKAFALSCAAELQIETVITPLVEFANLSPNYSSLVLSALSDFKTLKSVPFLVSMLNNHSSKVREETIASLRSIQDRRSLPFLINALHDEDETVAYLACYTLWGITGETPPPTLMEYPSKKSIYVKFWTGWAERHKDEMEKSRQQIEGH